MNYFLTKRHSRLVALLLTICMVATLFAGCSKVKPEDTEPSTEPDALPGGLVAVKPTETETLPPETTEPVNENMATVTTQTNVRSSPSTGAKIIGYLDPGTEVEIIKTETYMGVEWALIREGWIVMNDVKKNDGSSTAAPDDTTPEETKPEAPTNTTKITGKVTANGLYIRKEPSSTGEIVGNYAKDTTITILETKNGWGRTEKGWVSMTYVSTTGGNTGNTGNAGNTGNTGNTANTGNAGNAGNTTTTTGGTTYFITASELNIRDQAGTNGNKVGTYVKGDKVVVTETSNGWGKTDKGWISMNYAYKTGTQGTNTARGIVTGQGLNIRSGPGTGYDSVGSSYGSGTRVNILEQINGWGCTDKGWISLNYVYIDGTEGDGAGTGVVTGDNVNIRKGPGTGYESVGSLNEGDEVEILAQFEIDGTMWGCTEDGWVCMDYVGVG